MGGGGSAPQFNAQQVSQNQTASNFQTAAANAYLGAQSQYTPYGNLIYKETGQRQIGDGHGGFNELPIFEAHTELSPQQQQVLNQQYGLQQRALGSANKVAGQVDQAISTPLDFSGLAELPSMHLADQGAFRDQAYDALTARGNTEINRAQDNSRTLLKNQGVAEGSEAWRRGMEEFGNARNDLSNQSLINSTALAGQNQSQDIQGQEALFNNAFNRRTQGINERTAQRNQPLLDYQSLLGVSGGITQPQWTPPIQSQVANTDVTSPAMFGFQQQMNQYNQGQSANNALMGSLFGLGGSVLGGLAGGPLGAAAGGRVGGMFGGLVK